jgi:hypothetical protein
MRFWRTIASDRLSGGVLCVVLMLMFVAQIAVAGRAAAAAVSPDPLQVLCTAHDDTGRPADHGRECPCAELCGAGLSMPVAASPADGIGMPVRFADRVEVAVDSGTALPAAPVLRRPRATGPPSALERT